VGQSTHSKEAEEKKKDLGTSKKKKKKFKQATTKGKQNITHNVLQKRQKSPNGQKKCSSNSRLLEKGRQKTN